MKNRISVKYGFVLALFLVNCLSETRAQESHSYTQRLYETYVNDQMQEWELIIANMENAYESSGEESLLYELCFAYYGYIGYLISMEEDKEAKRMLNDAMKRTDHLEEIMENKPEVLALQGALIGYRIILSKFSSMFLGPKALRYIKTAYDTGENCFNCQTEMGNMKFYTPKFLGGSKPEALPYYEEALRIVENSRLKTDRDWIYMNTVLLLANAYKETGQEDKACALYEALMAYEPKAQWIRKDLYSKCK